MEWLFRATENLWTGMLVHLWQSTLVLLLLLVLSVALRNAPARLLSGLWWIGVLKLFLPLSLLGPLAADTLRPIVGNVGASSASTQEAWVSVTVWLYSPTLRAPIEPSTTATGLLYVILTLGWLVGLGWILARRLRLLRRSTATPLCADAARLARLEDKLDRALAGTAVPRGAILFVGGPGVPAVRGLLRPRTELPTRVTEALEISELTAVLLHEEEHRRRRDPLRSVPAALASWLFFFYPPLRWLLRKIHETTEMACDEAVLNSGIAARSYSRAIARTLALGLEPAYTQEGLAGPCRSSIRNRLDRLNTNRRYRTMTRHRLILGLAVVIALVGSVAPLTPGSPDPAKSGQSNEAAKSDPRFGSLDRLEAADQTVTLNFDRAWVQNVLQSLSKVAPFELRMHSSLGKKSVSIMVENVTLRDALIRLAEIAELTYMVPDPNTLWVGQVFLPGEGGVTSPQRIEASAVNPVYPETARENGITGRVILQAIIDETGVVSAVELLSTNRPEYPELTESAVEALEQWRYLPATRDGEPVSVYFTVVVEFELSKKNEKKAKPDPPRLGESI